MTSQSPSRTWSAAAAIVLAAAFVALAHPPWPLWPMAGLDAAAFERLQALRTPAGDAFFSAITVLGTPWAIGLLATAVATGSMAAGREREAWILFLCVAITALLCMELKVYFARARPLAGGSLLSFPSAHAAMSTSFYMTVAFLATRRPRFRRWGRFAIPAAAALAAFIGFSRMYLGAHWLSDVLAGHALGFVAFSIAATFAHGDGAPARYRPRARDPPRSTAR